MKYRFQAASNIQDYLPAIEGSEEFIIKRDEVNGYLVINYMFTCPTTFPDPMLLAGLPHRLAVLRRDCRGIKFDISTGDVVAKPYAKFFNVNQLPETQMGIIDWSMPHRVLEKRDGSMITAFKRQGAWQWHTKMGATDVAKPISDAVGDAYAPFCEAMREEGLTAIFEWTSRKQRIVLDYPEDELTLTGIRHNVSGQYHLYPAMVEIAARFHIPVVRAMDGSAEDIQRFLTETSLLEDAEGYVVRFDSGHMVKAKALLYCRIHGTKDTLNLEKNVWALVLHETVDDVKQFMDDKDKRAIDDFSNEFERRIRIKAAMLTVFVARAKECGDKKRFAVEVVLSLPKFERGMAFKIWDGQDPVTVIRQCLANNIATQTRIDHVRDFVGGLFWNDYYYGTPSDD
jgi:RNA ligase